MCDASSSLLFHTMEVNHVNSFWCFLQSQGEMVQWTVFLISFWGETIGQKVKKICDWLV